MTVFSYLKFCMAMGASDLLVCIFHDRLMRVMAFYLALDGFWVNYLL